MNEISAVAMVHQLGVKYLPKIPAEVPAGQVVVHNNVVPTRRLNSRGFRAWLIEPSDRLEVCDCDWAPELGEHYRVTTLPPEGWSPWEEDRRYPATDGEHMIIVYKRVVRYGDDWRVASKNSRRKLTAEERSGLLAEEAQS